MSLDTREARRYSCADCNEAESHQNHAIENSEGHFFNRGEPLLGPRALPPVARPERSATETRTKDHRRCMICGRERTFHRGPMDHKFSPPSNHTPTPAQILEAVDRALRSIRVAPRLKVGEIAIRPTYAADNDAELLSARVLIDLSLIFPAEGA